MPHSTSTRSLIQSLDWDSEFFGFRIGAACPGVTAEEVPRLVAEARDGQVRCLYFLAEAADRDMISMLERQGFGLRDVRLTLRHPNPAAAGSGGTDRRVRPAQEHDLDRLRRIARVSHRDSRFYFDLGFPRERCDDLYDVWIRRSYQDRFADAVLVADFENGAAGYITCRNLGSQRGQIGLLAVDESARHLGIGQALIAAALNWFASHGDSDAITVTQGRNLGAVRAYERAGFLAHQLQLWYHRWF